MLQCGAFVAIAHFYRPSVRTHLENRSTDLHEIWYWEILVGFVRTLQFNTKFLLVITSVRRRTSHLTRTTKQLPSHRKSNKMQQRIKILFHIYMKLAMFRAHTARHQELKTALAVSGFAYVEGCWTCSCWTWKVVGRVVAGSCQVEDLPYSVQQLHAQ